jgi:hypothetical protein
VPLKLLSRSHGLRRAVVRLAWSALLILPASVAAVTIRVGAIGDPACTAFSIQGAIAQLPPGLTEHRLLLSSNQAYSTAGVITDRSLRIEGGYANCSAEEPTPGARTQIGPDAAASAPLLTLRGTTGIQLPSTLRGLVFIGPAPQGAIRASGNMRVYVEDTLVMNAGDPFLDDAGGIAIADQTILHLRGNSQIIGNMGGEGGGVSCVDADLLLEGGDVLIANNQARLFGGGVALVDCEMDWTGGIDGNVGGIASNTAVGGGGISMREGSILSGFALEPAQRRVVSNSAEYFAGGIYAENSLITTTALELRDNTAGLRTTPAPPNNGNGGGIAAYASSISVSQLLLAGNQAERNGGGIWLDDGSSLSGDLPLSCPMGEPCHDLRQNIAGEAGGMAWLGSDSSLSLHRAAMEANEADTGAAIFAQGTAPSTIQVSILNSVLHANTATSALIAVGNSQLTIALSTLVDNDTGSSMVLDFGGNTHDWRASLMYGAPGSVLLSAPFGTTLSTDCLIGHENASVLAFGGDVFVDDDPGFVNRAQGDLRLRADAGAVDVCNYTEPSSIVLDLDGNLRPVDLPNPNVAGAYDVGAYERLPAAMFANGFE